MNGENKTKKQLIQEITELRKRVSELEALEPERKLTEEAAETSLNRSRQRQMEVSALLESSKEILKKNAFKEAAQSIFEACKNLIGATGGYISLLTKDGKENEALFIDSGQLSCTVDPALPFPVRGFREVAYLAGKAVYENDFPNSKWMEFMPKGHAVLENVLFVPLVIQGKTVGLLGLGNKPGGFTENDPRIASGFAELAAVALVTKRMEEERNLLLTELERRVEERTAELSATNEALRTEIAEHKKDKDALIEQSRIFEAFLKHALTPLVFLDKEFNFIRVNEAYARACQRDVSEFPGHNHFEFYPFDARAIFEEVVKNKKPYQAVARPFLFPDHPEWGETYWDWTLVPLLDDAGEMEFLVFSLKDVTERKQAEEAIKESQKQLKNLSSQRLKAHEIERKRIAREIHDGLGQYLTAIKFRVETFLNQICGTSLEEQAKFLQPIIPLIQEGVQEARRVQMDLRPSTLDDLGLLPTLSWFCRKFQETYSGIKVEQHIDICESEVPDRLKTTIYRILQEAMNNIAKHSKAGLVQIDLSKKGEQIELTIQDNGRGFDLQSLLYSEDSLRGLGLSSMKERTEISGGSYNIESAEGAGTLIRASWLGTELSNWQGD